MVASRGSGRELEAGMADDTDHGRPRIPGMGAGPPAPPDPPREAPPVESITELRSRVINLVLGVSCVFGVLSVVPVGGRVEVAAGARWLSLVYVGLILALIVAWNLRRRLSLRIRVWLMIVVSYVMGILGSTAFGNVVGPIFAFIMACVYATTLIGRRVGMAVFAISLVTICIFAAMYVTGELTYNFDIEAYFRSPSTWASYILTFLWVATLIIGITSIMNESFLSSIATLGRRTEELQLSIEQRDRTERALRVTEKSYEELFNASPDALFVQDSESTAILSVNRTMLEKLGYGRNELSALTLGDLVSGDGRLDPSEILDLVRQAASGEPQLFDRRVRRKDGSVFWAEVSLKLTEIEGHARVLGSIRNVTARRQAEEEVERSRDQLEVLVTERTAELESTQAELIRTERLAVLGQLTATVGHEIRNPLGTIKNAVFSIEDAINRGEPNRAERALILAKRNITRCDAIISELLDFTRSPETERVATEMDGWVAELLTEESHLFASKGGECTRRLGSGVTLSVDQDFLRRAVVNLVTNALDALADVSAGEVLVETTIAAGRFEIKVSDNGPGIPTENLEKVFEPLFSTKTFGVGLGVPIVKKIAEDHGGGLEVQSEVDNGTTFTLWLPLS
jgi:PAS domain S-box-containing protein